MSDIERYVVCEDPDEWGDAPVYEQYLVAKEEASKLGQCVIALTYEYTDSELVDDFRGGTNDDDES